MHTDLLDHLIAADCALARVGRLAAGAVLNQEIHSQDLAEWIEQLRDHLDAIPNE
ncbi:hypothetical protein RB608_18155 [Nocardioides sp. LHD-245]|uniref:hypothetical protein n=1 Tax=Nocardioides sp. LHD-245 TaxID=3051387 RepID=UPI0027E0516B|nr:hypothetical protein [Nocardioides sp. LHD-245]